MYTKQFLLKLSKSFIFIFIGMALDISIKLASRSEVNNKLYIEQPNMSKFLFYLLITSNLFEQLYHLDYNICFTKYIIFKI